MSRKSNESPLHIDKPFNEALARFAQTDPKEVEQLTSKEGKRMPKLQWSKTLSTTDAQQPTSGGIVPYLRLTRGDQRWDDFQTVFRDNFFASAPWAVGAVGQETGVEIAKVPMDVTVSGLQLPSMVVEISHGPNRHLSNNAPNTWLHWPPTLQQVLMSNDCTGKTATLTRLATGQFQLVIA